jgi:hypothetical protein
MELNGSAFETDKREVKHRAMVMAVQTGNMPDVDLIWSVQRFEGNRECFGQRGYCWQRKMCKWGGICGQLAEVKEIRETEAPQMVQARLAPDLAAAEVLAEVTEGNGPVWMTGPRPDRRPPEQVFS